jgi:hypothetical protein
VRNSEAALDRHSIPRNSTRVGSKSKPSATDTARLSVDPSVRVRMSNASHDVRDEDDNTNVMVALCAAVQPPDELTT